ncbi:hypothetical protein CERZMDRAFT_101848 [Cercospora zeae-maydis SCOH1-5]|uniref:Uncharacterized protein n=1 Tax=Cercospora zeae-maydis SCOH1-5 TaxID=717836 RepID=A0A6A6F5Z7_9PEZI|nr:hypothetical protein CERZMDRAFT_101848 [Cercospora zeae-maydis SCOH1-5]
MSLHAVIYGLLTIGLLTQSPLMVTSDIFDELKRANDLTVAMMTKPGLLYYTGTRSAHSSHFSCSSRSVTLGRELSPAVKDAEDDIHDEADDVDGAADEFDDIDSSPLAPTALSGREDQEVLPPSFPSPQAFKYDSRTKNVENDKPEPPPTPLSRRIQEMLLKSTTIARSAPSNTELAAAALAIISRNTNQPCILRCIPTMVQTTILPAREGSHQVHQYDSHRDEVLISSEQRCADPTRRQRREHGLLHRRTHLPHFQSWCACRSPIALDAKKNNTALSKDAKEKQVCQR